MGLSKKHFLIAEVLAAFFTNTQTEQQEEEYEIWEKERESNRDLAKHVLDKDNYIRFERIANRFDRQKGWKVFKDSLIKNSEVTHEIDLKSVTREKDSRRRLNRFRYLIGYAAVGIILISCGMFYWINRPIEEKRETIFAYQIDAGTTGARLTMADGKVVDIVKDQTFLLKEQDGTMIVTDSAGIDYLVHEVKDEKKEVRNTIQTLTGMEYTLTLSDGTIVYLNAESEINFPVSFKGEQRIIELSGEAYFVVAKDEKHPFVVKTPDLSVKGLGTSFNLRAYGNEKNVVTTLAEGKVQVFDGQKFRDITPGEQVVYEKETKNMQVKQVDVSRYTAWRDGKFIFRNERLEDIMMYLARWYNVQYKFMDDKVKDIRIGAKLNRYSDMSPIIEMLKTNAEMSVCLVDGVYYISVR